MMHRAPWRITADDYEAFIIQLCGLPPGPERAECVRELTGKLLALYAKHGSDPPSGLQEYAVRIGLSTAAPKPS